MIKARLADHLEAIRYSIPGFRQPGPKGRMVAGYAGFKLNCGSYPHAGSIIGQFPVERAGFATSKGGILFAPDHPLSESLVFGPIEARLTETVVTGR